MLNGVFKSKIIPLFTLYNGKICVCEFRIRL